MHTNTGCVRLTVHARKVPPAKKRKTHMQVCLWRGTSGFAVLNRPGTRYRNKHMHTEENHVQRGAL